MFIVSPNPCKHCGKKDHYSFRCFLAPKKPIARNSKPKAKSVKQREYENWLYYVARPLVIERDGYKCSCCGREDKPLDMEHTLGKGSHPELKRDVNNLKLMCRIPCHHLKTIGKPCNH